jgi:hypothetical protein
MIIRDEVINHVRRCKIHFDSQIEAANYLRGSSSNWRGSSTASPSHNWDFNVGNEGAERLAIQGWSEGAKDLSDRLAVHMPERDHVASWRYDVAGEMPDIGRYLSGDPVHMRRHGHPKGHKPIISLFINNWIVCHTTAQQMANYGAAMVSLIDQLENSGRRVEVVAGTIAESMSDSRVMMSATWKVKGAEDHLDLGALAFAVAHPAASRRFGWRLWERTAAPTDTYYGSGRGRVTDEHDLIDPMPGTLIINGIKMSGSSCDTLEGALMFAAGQINDAAGETLVTVEG